MTLQFLAAALPLLLGRPSARDTDAVRLAALTEALRVVQASPSGASSRTYCLAVEPQAELSARVVAHLAKRSGLVLYAYSECILKGLFVAEPSTLGGFNNLVAIDGIRWPARRRAEVDVRLLGGSARIDVTREKGRWKGVCCPRGIIGGALQTIERAELRSWIEARRAVLSATRRD